ncbi:MAG: MGMT family protein [Paeniglutamicibacter terrestris]|uniref:MGMT family protein n=1 Tax=Paeniglutamicibacter terrestris TaxID=2723403 RepID=UPI003159BEFA
MDRGSDSSRPGAAITEDGASGTAVGLDYDEAVFAVVELIPSGKVLAYGDIAELLGIGGARQVGKAMGRGDSNATWWRVIRSNGTLPSDLQPLAESHWEAEGTPRTPTRVRMNVARWEPTDAEHTRIDGIAELLPMPNRHPRMI